MSLARIGGWWRLWIVATATYGAIVLALTLQFVPGVEDIPYDAGQLKQRPCAWLGCWLGTSWLQTMSLPLLNQWTITPWL